MQKANGGINIGRTSWAKDGDNGIFVHEGMHWKQQTEDGFGKFYGQIFIDYATHILRYGDINAIYTTNGSYDNLANEIETNYKNR